MSLILDALNRADQERSDGDKAPSIRTVHAPIQQTEKPVKRWLIEGLVLLLTLSVIVYLLFVNQRPADFSAPASPAAVVPPATEPKPEPQAPTTVIKPLAAAPATAISAKPLAADTTPPKPVVKKTAASSDPKIASLYQQTAIQPKPAPAPAPAPKTNNNTPSAAAKKPANTTATILAQLPYLAELPARFQNTVPSINYSIHIYSETEDSGAVNLNGSMLRVGNEVEPELRVIAILKDSVVLDYRGTQFRLIALNSWVNFN